MAETGQTNDVAILLEKLTAALVENSVKHGAATAPRRVPAWLTTVIATLIGMFLTMSVTGLMRFATLEARVTAVENVHPETVNVLASEVHNLSQQIGELTRRFNDYQDQSRRRDREQQ